MIMQTKDKELGDQLTSQCRKLLHLQAVNREVSDHQRLDLVDCCLSSEASVALVRVH